VAWVGLQKDGTEGMKTRIGKAGNIAMNRCNPLIQSQDMKRIAAGLAMIMIAWCASAAVCEESWSGKCVGISDGDTILVMQGRRQVKIRLHGIDCPEMGQDFGAQARRFTGQMVFGKIVIVQEMDRDRYGRTVAWVWVDGQSLNKELVKAGFAWWYRYYALHDEELRTLEAKARKDKLGLWSQPNPIPPWKFRRESRTD
jgi:micrococcal nuclease